MGDLVQRATMAVVAIESRSMRRYQSQVVEALAHEDGDTLVRDRRIENGYSLGRHTALRAAAFNREVTELSHDNPALEMGLRHLEQLILGSATAIVVESLL